MHCDFQGTAAQARGPMNAPIAVTASACYYVLLALGGGEVPPNSGAYRALTVAAPPGTLVNPSYPAPVVAGNTEMSVRVVDLLLQALAPAMADRVIAESYGCAGVWAIGGWDVERKRHFVHEETVGGGMGACARSRGLGGHQVHMGNTMNLPIEAVEAALRVTIERYELIAESGGSGQHPGGMGVRRVIRARADGVQFSLLFERALHPAQGVADGGAGRAANFHVLRADGVHVALSSKTVAGGLERGDRLFMETAGGGGWGAIKVTDSPAAEEKAQTPMAPQPRHLCADVLDQHSARAVRTLQRRLPSTKSAAFSPTAIDGMLVLLDT